MPETHSKPHFISSMKAFDIAERAMTEIIVSTSPDSMEHQAAMTSLALHREVFHASLADGRTSTDRSSH
jgi:NAD/NADP transhydrogenase alpha subunit